MTLALIAGLTILTASGDTVGFIFADRAWANGRIDWSCAALALAGYAVGVSSYIAVLGPIKRAIDVPPEIQTLAWFALTSIGVAIASRAALGWSADKIAAGVIAVSCLGYLVARS